MNRPVSAMDRTSKGRRIKSWRRGSGLAESGWPLLSEACPFARAGERIGSSILKIKSLLPGGSVVEKNVGNGDPPTPWLRRDKSVTRHGEWSALGSAI
jgi:hypothetical protein